MNLYYGSYNKGFILNLPTNFSIEIGELSMLNYNLTLNILKKTSVNPLFYKIRIQIMIET